jgi:hypothetical protein
MWLGGGLIQWLTDWRQSMNDDWVPAAMATWAARNLPARLDVVATAKLRGFTESDIHILMAVGKLTPLGDPAPNAPKWFAAVEIIQLATDQEWLHKATKEVAKYWRQKRGRRMNLEPTGSTMHGYFELSESITCTEIIRL